MSKTNLYCQDTITQVLILSSRDPVKTNLVAKIASFPNIKVICVGAIEQFWQFQASTKYDFLFLDEDSLDSNGQNLFTNLCSQSFPLPIILISQDPSSNLLSIYHHQELVGTLLVDDISLQDVKGIIQLSEMSQRLTSLMTNHSILFYGFSTFMDKCNNSVIIWDKKGVIRQFNKAAETLLGISEKSLLGKDINSDFFSHFFPSFIINLALCTADDTELQYIDPQGENRLLLFEFAPLPDVSISDQSVGSYAVISEITDQNLILKSKLQKTHFANRVMNSSPNIIYIWDLRKNCILFITPAIKEILGFASEEIIEKKPEELADALGIENIPDFLAHLQKLKYLKENEVIEYEYHLHNKQHEWRWLKSQETVFYREKDGTPSIIIGSAQDITRLKLIQTGLQKQIKRERLINELACDFLCHGPDSYSPKIQSAIAKIQKIISPCAIFIYEKAGIYLTKTHEVTATRKLPVIPKLLEFETLKFIQDALLLNQHFIYESDMNLDPILRTIFSNLFYDEVKSAGIFPITINNCLFGILVLIPKDSSAHLSKFDISIIQSFTNILAMVTQNQKFYFELRQNKKESAGTEIDNKADLIVQFTPNGTLTYVNDAFCEYFKHEKDEITKKNFLEGLPVADRERIFSVLKMVNRNHKVHTLEHCDRQYSNPIRWQKWEFRAIFDSKGEVKEYQSIGQDITETKIIETVPLFSSTSEIQAIKHSPLGEFATDITQKINNPLTTIIAEAQILMKELEPQNPEWDSAQAILQAGLRAQNEIDDLKNIF
jgi:PAS domain S-box-containing protein